MSFDKANKMRKENHNIASFATQNDFKKKINLSSNKKIYEISLKILLSKSKTKKQTKQKPFLT